MLLHEIIYNAAAARPGDRALVDGERSWNFAELAACIRGLARWVGATAGPGGSVAIASENSAEYVMALYGVPAASCTLVHCNTRHTPEEIADTIGRSGASVLLGSPEQLTRLAAIDLPGVEHRVGLAELPTDGVTSGSSGTVSSARETDMAWLMYTSGTTGRPKGVVLTHRSLLAAALNTTMCRRVSDDEVYLYPFPLFHVAAYNVVHLHLRQRPVVLLDRFEPAAAFDAIRRHSVTSVSLAPTMLAMMLDHPGRDDSAVATLRSVSYGAAAMPLELMRRSLREWPEVGLAQGYGMTELSGNAVFLSPEDHRLAAGE